MEKLLYSNAIFYDITFWRKLLHNLQRLLAYLYQVDAMGCIGERQ